MTKRLVDIDDDLLQQARAVAKARTIKGTVEVALKRLVDGEAALRHVRRLRGRGALDLAQIDQARSPRTGFDG